MTHEAPPTPARSALMSNVRQKNTTSELTVRRCLHALGYRFRLHRADLPGTPDIVLPRFHKVIFVHGCFWHRHAGCPKTTTPKTRVKFWSEKFRANIRRDEKNMELLNDAGWRTLVIWECETRDTSGLKRKLLAFVAKPAGAGQFA